MDTQTTQNIEQSGQGAILDESSMIREQDRLAREQKKKKNRRKKRIAGAFLLALAAGGVWYLGWGRGIFARQADNQVKIKVREGQEIVYARLDSVRGNEIVYTVAEPSGASLEESGAKGAYPGGENQSDSEEPALNTTGGQDQAGDGFPPDGGRMTTGSLSGDGGKNMGAVRGKSNKSSQETASGLFTYDNVAYQLTEETATAQIPVGTDVTTKLGAVTTFLRLSAGDYVALIEESDGDSRVITAVYIIG